MARFTRSDHLLWFAAWKVLGGDAFDQLTAEVVEVGAICAGDRETERRPAKRAAAPHAGGAGGHLRPALRPAETPPGQVHRQAHAAVPEELAARGELGRMKSRFRAATSTRSVSEAVSAIDSPSRMSMPARTRGRPGRHLEFR